MVECKENLDRIFSSLSDTTRRDILRRVTRTELSIKDIAAAYPLSFAAVAKHIHILEGSRLIRKRKKGRQQIVSARPSTLAAVQKQLDLYAKIWEKRYQNLESLLHN